MVARKIKFIIFACWFAKLQKLRDCFTAFFIWILVLVCAVEFMPHKRALVREKQNTLFFLARPRKLLRLIAAKRGKNNVLPQSVPLTSFVQYFAAFCFLSGF